MNNIRNILLDSNKHKINESVEGRTRDNVIQGIQQALKDSYLDVIIDVRKVYDEGYDDTNEECRTFRNKLDSLMDTIWKLIDKKDAFTMKGTKK